MKEIHFLLLMLVITITLIYILLFSDFIEGKPRCNSKFAACDFEVTAHILERASPLISGEGERLRLHTSALP